jgi:adenosylhomocysteine nucleosidase
MVLGIMSAMTEEINTLIAKLEGPRTPTTIGGRDYYVGSLWGVPSVAVFSRWGKVAAATTATCLITKFGVEQLVFTGVAGGTDPALAIGDVVVATALYQHDMDARPLFPRHEIPLLGVSRLETDAALRRECFRAAQAFLSQDYEVQVSPPIRQEFGITEPKVVEGEVATGDKFFAEKADIHALKARLPSVVCVEMEGAAVAQVCFEYRVPLAVIRTISDAAVESAIIDFPKFIKQVACVYSHGILKRLIGARAATRPG